MVQFTPKVTIKVSVVASEFHHPLFYTCEWTYVNGSPSDINFISFLTPPPSQSLVRKPRECITILCFISKTKAMPEQFFISTRIAFLFHRRSGDRRWWRAAISFAGVSACNPRHWRRRGTKVRLKMLGEKVLSLFKKKKKKSNYFF